MQLPASCRCRLPTPKAKPHLHILHLSTPISTGSCDLMRTPCLLRRRTGILALATRSLCFTLLYCTCLSDS
jgi:hypothetical protein